MKHGALHEVVRWIVGLVIILGAWGMGEELVLGLHLPVPGPVVGLGCLFLGFATVSFLVDTVQPTAQTLLRNFPLFLYPLGAGFLTLSGLGPVALLKIVIAVAVSLVLSLVIGTHVFRFFKRNHG